MNGEELGDMERKEKKEQKAMERGFRIAETKRNRDNSFPAHWDVFPAGSEESICTVWDSEAMAEMFVTFLGAWAEKRKQGDGPKPPEDTY